MQERRRKLLLKRPTARNSGLMETRGIGNGPNRNGRRRTAQMRSEAPVSAEEFDRFPFSEG